MRLSQFPRMRKIALASAVAAIGMVAGTRAQAQPQHDAIDKALGYDTGREQREAHAALPAGNELINSPTAEPQAEYYLEQDYYQGRPRGQRFQYQQRYQSNRPSYQTNQPGRTRLYSSDQRQPQAPQYQNYDQNNAAAGRQNAGQSMGVTWSISNGTLTARRVSHDSDMARAGLEPGDQVLSVNGQRVQSPADFNRALSTAQAGRQVPIVVNRDGEHEKFYWAPGGQQVVYNQNQPQRQSAQRQDSSYDERNRMARSNGGRRFSRGQQSDEAADQGSNLTVISRLEQGRDGRAFLGVQLDPRHGDEALVRRVYPDSPAERAGLRSGDVIMAVNGQRIQSPEDLTDHISELNSGDRVRLAVDRDSNNASQQRSGIRDSNQSGQRDDQRRRQDWQNSERNRDDLGDRNASRQRDDQQERDDDSDD